MANDLDSQTRALRRIGALNIADLEINQKGYLAPRQTRKPILIIILWTGLAVFEIAVLIALLIYELSFQRNTWISLMTFAVLTFCSALSMLNAQPYWRDLTTKRVKTVSGKSFKKYSFIGYGRSNICVCSIRVGDLVFGVSPALYDVVVENKTYRTYYLPDSKLMVNIEPM
jgi:hypothetical protein